MWPEPTNASQYVVSSRISFNLLLLLMLHIALFAWLVRSQGPVWAALIVAFVDLVLVALLGWLASRNTVDPVSLEAERVRDEALAEAKDNTTRAVMLAPLLRSQTAKKGIIGAAVTAGVVGLLTRRR